MTSLDSRIKILIFAVNKTILSKVIISVTNDLVTDQRVNRVCISLQAMGFEVLLVGRKLPNSLPLPQCKYKMHRMYLLFKKGPLFYAEYNIRLFLFLLTHKSSLLVSNDLDTLAANYIASILKRNNLVYDSHEYYCGTPELLKRAFVRNFWLKIERWIFPKLTDIFTVNKSIADLYKKEYNKTLHVVRNIPIKKELRNPLSKKELGLPDDKKILLLQGAGINIDRGVEELVDSMQYVTKKAVLVIVGSGDVIDILKQNVVDLKLSSRVKFVAKVPMEKLISYTNHADLGFTVDKDTNINYRYSLPNKLFDYIHAGVPVISSELIEISKIIKKYNVGTFIKNHDPKHIAEVINLALSDNKMLEQWKRNCVIASNELTWKNEEKELIKVYSKYAR